MAETRHFARCTREPLPTLGRPLRRTAPLPYGERINLRGACRTGRVKRLLTLRTASLVSYSVRAPQGPFRRAARPLALSFQSERDDRPEAAPKPSTSASVPSRVDSLAFTSHKRA